MGRLWLVPVLLLVWVCGSGTAEACRCTSRSATCGPPAEFWQASAVFAGRVVAIERLPAQRQPYANLRRARFQILERFRGAIPAAGDEIAIFTEAATGCGYPFKAGHAYLVYASRQEDGRLTASVCSRTSPLERAEGDVAYGRNAAAGNAGPGRISGDVRLATEHPARWKPAPNFSFAVTRNGTRIVAVTDGSGRYSVEVHEAGTYLLDIPLPETQYTPHAGRQVEVPDARSCVETHIDILFNGTVSGRVVDAAGKGVAGLTISYARSRGAEGLSLEHRRMVTRDDGSYEIDRVAPGAFTLAVELPAGANGVADGASQPNVFAKHGRLRGGERLTLEPLALPSDVKLSRLTGTVHSADGGPAADVRVFLKGEGESGRILGAPATTDSLGRFVIAALDGETYQVFAERNAGSRTSFPEFSDPVTITASPALVPLRLTVRRRF